jgi:L-alanine-DL-glutamate epimerase-like enolase superfamily enzyme
MSERKRPKLPPEWQKAERLTRGIYRLHTPDGKYRYGFAFPDGTFTSFSSRHPISLEDLRLHYRAEVRGRRDQEMMRKGLGPTLEEIERAQKRRWEKFKRLGLVLEREGDAALLDD